MTLENNLERIATSLELIAAALSAKPAPVATPVTKTVKKETPIVAPVTEVVAAPVVTPVVTPEPTMMPPVPVFTAPAVTPIAQSVLVQQVLTSGAAPVAAAAFPFSDKNELAKFVITKFQELGEKGMQIQQILLDIGHANVSDVPPEKWAQLKASIEAIK